MVRSAGGDDEVPVAALRGVPGAERAAADEALVSRLSLQAVGYDAAMALGKRFLAAVQR